MIRIRRSWLAPAIGAAVVLCGCLIAEPSFGGHFPWDQGHDTFEPEPPEDEEPAPDDVPDPSEPDPDDPDCNDNPDQPQCAPDFCDQNPDHPLCTDEDPDCNRVPSHPKCDPDYCDENPSDPFCAEDPDPEDDPTPEDPDDAPEPGDPEPANEPSDPDEPDYDPCQNASPFEAASGNFVYSFPDISHTFLGPDFEFTRHYNSKDDRNGPMGRGWTHSYDMRLIAVTDGVSIAAVCRNGLGQRNRFRRRPDGTYRPPRDLHANLTREIDGTWTLVESGGQVKRFSADGLLASIADGSGNEMTFAYDATGFLTTVTTASGLAYTLTKGANGKIASITDPLSRDTWYDYDLDGNLAMVTNAISETVDLIYGVDGKLTQIRDHLDRVVQDLTYDAWGRVKSLVEDGETWTVEYFPSKNKTIKIDSQGQLWKIYYNNNGNVVRRVDPLGERRDLYYDRRLRPIEYVDERGSSWRLALDSRGRPVAATDPGGNTTTFEYQDAGDLPTVVVSPGGRQSVLAYDAAGRLLSITDDVGLLSSWEYHPNGRVESHTDANGATTAFFYDSNENLFRIVDRTGAEMLFSYDSIGRVTSFTDAAGRQTETGYDDLDRVTSVLYADGTEQTRAYSTTCPTCEGRALLSSVTDATNRTWSTAWDEYGRRTSETDSAGYVLSYSLDDRGLPTTVSDSAGRTASNTWDVARRPIELGGFDGTVTGLDTDPAGNVIELSAANQTSFLLTLNALSRIVAVSSDATGEITRTYSPDNQRASNLDPLGIVASYAYDERGRLTGVSFPDPSENITYAWDEPASENGGGRLTLVSGLGAATRFHYDEEGRLTREETTRDGSTHVTSYSYDAGGLLIGVVYPSGLEVSYRRNSVGLIDEASVTDNGVTHAVASSIEYDAAGRLTQLVHGNGLQETRTYDAAGRLASIEAGAVQNLVYGYDSAGRVQTITDLLDPARSRGFGYDDVDRLTSAIGPWGSIAYTYDAAGDRTSRSDSAGTATYQYSGSLLTSITGSVTRTYGHNLGGAVTSLTSAASLGFTYDQRGRLAEVRENGSFLAAYEHDARGLRSRKDTVAGSEAYHYDQFGRLLEVSDTLGNTLVSYVYFGGWRPLAQWRSGGLLHYSVDHLGTPVRLTDASSSVVWSSEHLPFGELFQETGTAEQPLRFPGQVWDPETGLHYNGYRYYDPTTGLYLRPDDLSPAGGWRSESTLDPSYDGRGRYASVYRYVFGDPVNSIDPTGLRCVNNSPWPVPIKPESDSDPIQWLPPGQTYPGDIDGAMPPAFGGDWWKVPTGTDVTINPDGKPSNSGGPWYLPDSVPDFGQRTDRLPGRKKEPGFSDRNPNWKLPDDWEFPDDWGEPPQDDCGGCNQ